MATPAFAAALAVASAARADPPMLTVGPVVGVPVNAGVVFGPPEIQATLIVSERGLALVPEDVLAARPEYVDANGAAGFPVASQPGVLIGGNSVFGPARYVADNGVLA